MNLARISAAASGDDIPRPDLNTTLEQARQAMQRRDWLNAARSWETVRSLSPDHAPAYVGGANALRQAGRLDDAERLLAEAATRFPDHEGIAIAFAGLATARRDWPSAIIRWETARTSFPDNPSCHLGSINALQGAQRNDEADALLPEAARVSDAAKRRGVETVASLQLALTVAKARQDWPAARAAAEAIIAREPQSPPQTHLSLAQACWHAGALDAADQAARRALDLDPVLIPALIVATWVATEKGDGAAALKCYRRLVLLQPNTMRWSLKLVELLNWLGQVDQAVVELDRVCRRWPNHPIVIRFLARCAPGSALARETDGANAPDHVEAGVGDYQALSNAAPGEALWKRPPLVPAGQQELQILATAGAEMAVLVFTGADDGISMPLNLFDRYLAPLEVTTIYLKDFRRLVYLRGIRSVSDDYPGALAALRTILERYGAKRLATIGSGDGAFAAIRYGVELGAARVLATGPVTHLPEEPVSRLDQRRNFGRAQIAAMVAPDMTDLKPFLESRTHPTKIELFFRQEDERERGEARRISHVPGVRLHPIAGGAATALHRLALSTENFHAVLGAWLGAATAA
jgi:tetratricopeptide (TPR) repeat protein